MTTTIIGDNMSYTATMSNTEIRRALSYLLYKKMKRKNVPEDDQTSRLLKDELLSREKEVKS